MTKSIPKYDRAKRCRKGKKTGMNIKFPHLFSQIYIKEMGKLPFRRTVMYLIRHAHAIDIDGMNAAYSFVHKLLQNTDAWTLDYIDLTKSGINGIEEFTKLKELCSAKQHDEEEEINEMLK